MLYPFCGSGGQKDRTVPALSQLHPPSLGLPPQVRPPGPGSSGKGGPRRRGGAPEGREQCGDLGMESGVQSPTTRGISRSLDLVRPLPDGRDRAQRSAGGACQETALASHEVKSVPPRKRSMELWGVRWALAPVKPRTRPVWGNGIS